MKKLVMVLVLTLTGNLLAVSESVCDTFILSYNVYYTEGDNVCLIDKNTELSLLQYDEGHLIFSAFLNENMIVLEKSGKMAYMIHSDLVYSMEDGNEWWKFVAGIFYSEGRRAIDRANERRDRSRKAFRELTGRKAREFQERQGREREMDRSLERERNRRRKEHGVDVGERPY